MSKLICFSFSFIPLLFFATSVSAKSFSDSLLLKKRTFVLQNNSFRKKTIIREGFTEYDRRGNQKRSWTRTNSPRKKRSENHSTYEYDELNRQLKYIRYNGNFDSRDIAHFEFRTFTDNPNEICKKSSGYASKVCTIISEEKLSYNAYISEYGENSFLQPFYSIDSVLIKKKYKNDKYSDREIYFYKYDSLGRVSYEFQNAALGANSTHITYTYEKQSITKAYSLESFDQWMNQEKDDGITYVTTTFNTESIKIRQEYYTYSKARGSYYNVWLVQNFDENGNIVKHEYGGNLYTDRIEKYSNRVISTTYHYKYDSLGKKLEERIISKVKKSRIIDETYTYTYEYW